MAFFNYFNTNSTATTVQIVRLLDSFAVGTRKLRDEARCVRALKRERCIESQRIAAQLEPRTHAVLRLYARRDTKRRNALMYLRQPPSRFAFYQGAF
jgi:hypothetical protein